MKEHKILREIFWIIWFEKFDYYPDYGIFVKKSKIFESWIFSEKEIILSIEEIMFDSDFISNLINFLYTRIWFLISKNEIEYFIKNKIFDYRFYFFEELEKYLKILEKLK